MKVYRLKNIKNCSQDLEALIQKIIEQENHQICTIIKQEHLIEIVFHEKIMEHQDDFYIEKMSVENIAI